jgi:CheY-like chemotaxis protein
MIEVSDSNETRPARLADARAEFVASLARRLQALRDALHALEQEPRSAARRDHLLRRIHAMASASRVLGFASIVEALTRAEALIQRGGRSEVLRAELDEVGRAIELIPSLASGATLSIRPARAEEPDPAPDAEPGPCSLLVFGPTELVAALRFDGSEDLEIERTDQPPAALELARALGPDVVIIDSDTPGARELMEEMVGDALLERMPLVVLGEFDNPRLASEYVALGATRVLVKPVSPETLRSSIQSARQSAGASGDRGDLGELTVEALADRIASEVRRGLVDSVEPGGRELPVELGPGADVLGAVWGAVARVRELVTVRSSGRVRFAGTGPEGAVPVAPWRSSERDAGARSRGVARSDDGVSLQGRRVLVADDDPAMAWFISGLLRAVGAEVLEAHDGRRALDLAFETWPDALVSDVLMPELDGFALCRELKRDVALRDVPVILLSWKEDLLQRLRGIGADASGYLRKEASASTVIQRVREVLRPRARVESRLQSGGEVRGRLDDLTPRLVLELSSARQPNCRVSIRDAVYLYELQIRDGRPQCVTRTSSDGTFGRGDAVLAPLLGVTAGRFVVAPDESGTRRDFDGSLTEVLADPIARVRAAQHAFSEGRLVRLQRVDFDEAALRAYTRVHVEPVRSLVERLTSGESPRELLLSGTVSAKLLESVMMDLARNGAVQSVTDEGGVNVLEQSEAPLVRFEEAKRAEYTTLTPPPSFALVISDEPPGVASARPPSPAAPAELDPPLETMEPSEHGLEASEPSEPPEAMAPSEQSPLPSASSEAPEPSERSADAAPVALLAAKPTASAGAEKSIQSSAEEDPVDLADAVLGSVSDSSAMPPPVVESRDSTSPEPGEAAAGGRGDAEREDEEQGARPDAEQGDALRDSVEEESSPPAVTATEVGTPQDAEGEADDTPEPAANRTAERPVVEPRGGGSSGLRVAAITLAAGLVSFGAVRFLIAPRLTQSAPSAPSEATASRAASGAGVGQQKQAPSAPAAEDLPLPPEVMIADTKGLLEISSSSKHAIYVDGAFVGRGPVRRVPLDPGRHEIELRDGLRKTTAAVTIRQGRRARLTLGADAERAGSSDSL